MHFGVASLAMALTCSAACLAGTVEVGVVPASGGVEVEAKDASVDEILKQIGTAKGIAIERIGDVPIPRTWSGHVVGRVDEVLARVLENENYVVEHSAAAKAGISRVRVFAATSADDADVPQQPSMLTPQQATVAPTRAPLPPQPAPSKLAAPSPPAQAAPPRAPNVIMRSSRQPQMLSQPRPQTGAQVRGGIVQ